LSKTEVHVEESFEALTENPEPLLKALSPWFLTRRWSGLGGLDVERIEVLDWVKIPSSPSSGILATLVQIAPREEATREPMIFYVPLHLKTGRSEDGWVPVGCLDGVLQVREAEYSKEYNDFLLHGAAESLALDSCKGSLIFKSLETIPGGLEAENVTILGKGDTTNIVVKVETGRTQALVLKTYKNVTESNPEPEMLAVLTKAGFENVPKMVGEMTHTGLGRPLVLTILQKFVESMGDGGQPFAESLRRELKGSSSPEAAPSDPLRLARRLGEIIASMHHALGHSRAEGFGASPITKRDIKEWKTRVEELLGGFLEEAQYQGKGLYTPASELVDAVASRKGRILDCLTPMGMMLGMMKIRTHQDLHLAQLLATQDDETDFLIIDFEGDPQRKGESRRRKECPLRDLGTMARSFSYLRYGVLKGLLEEAGHADGLRLVASYDLAPQLNLTRGTLRIPSIDSWIPASRKWEAKARRAMIEGYLAAVERLGDRFLSETGKTEFETTDSVVKLWEIEKALLEARYELHHRPQNLTIPLAGLLTLCS